MKTEVFDCETNGLLDELTTIHSLVLKDPATGNRRSYAKGDVEQGVRELEKAELLVGQNIIRFDIPAIKKVFPWFNPKGKVRDTQVMSSLAYSDMFNADMTMRARREKRGKKWIPGNLFGRHSLEAWGYRLGVWKGDYAKEREAQAKELGIPKEEIVQYVWGTWNQEMQDYCEQDVEVTEKLWVKLCRKLEEWGLDPLDFNPKAGKDAIQMEHDVAAIMFRQEQYGFKFDLDKASKLYAHLSSRKVELEEKLQETFPPWYRKRERVIPKKSRSVKRADLDVTVTKRRFSKKTGKELKPYVGPVKEHYTEGAPYTKVELRPFNPGSRPDAIHFLKTRYGWKPVEFTKAGNPELGDEVLSSLEYPEAKLLAEYFMVTKRLGQLAEGKKSWLQNVRKDGRVPAGVNPNGAVTGRMTHYGVANVPGIYDKKTGEKLPYGAECRELFCADEGKVIVGVDADALELRNLAGYMSRYDGGAYIKTVLEGKKSEGTDMHTQNATALGGIFRETAKTWFYAFIYGAWFLKLGITLGATGTQKAIIEAGKKAQEKFLKNLPALDKLIKAVQRRGKKRGYIVSLDGRRVPIRKLHAALNTLLQSAGAVIMKRALVLLDNALQDMGLVPGENYEFVANMHDEFQIETDEDKGTIVAEKAKWAIAEAGRFYDFWCPITGSADIGLNWKETH